MQANSVPLCHYVHHSPPIQSKKVQHAISREDLPLIWDPGPLAVSMKSLPFSESPWMREMMKMGIEQAGSPLLTFLTWSSKHELKLVCCVEFSKD